MESSSIQVGQQREKEQVVRLGVLATFFSLIPTAYAAYISNSAVLRCDLLRCSAEFFAILLSWLVLRKISREDRSTYNFGFGKLEQLASIAVAGALFTTFMVSLISGIHRFMHPEPLESGWFGLVFALLSVAGNIFLWLKNYAVYRRHPSPVLEAQWRLFRAKTYAILVVVVSLAVSMSFHGQAWSLYFDSLGSIALSFFLLRSAYLVVSSSVPDLIDRAVEERIQMIILRTLIKHEANYLGFERVRSRRSGGKMFVDLFLTFEGGSLLRDVDRIVRSIALDLQVALAGSEVIVIPSVYSK